MSKRLVSWLVGAIAVVFVFSFVSAHLPPELKALIYSAYDSFSATLKSLPQNGNEQPLYFSYLSTPLSFLYFYLLVPTSMLMASYVLISYSLNMLSGDRNQRLAPSVRFRRGVATLLPFLISLYAVVADQFYRFPSVANAPFYWLLFSGFFVGFLFLLLISRVSGDELFAILSCFASSTVFFSVLTVFVISRSFQVISFVFGFLFGICVYIILNGMTDVRRLVRPQFHGNPF